MTDPLARQLLRQALGVTDNDAEDKKAKAHAEKAEAHLKAIEAHEDEEEAEENCATNAAPNQPRHAETGQYLPHNAGVGKGPTHMAARDGYATYGPEAEAQGIGERGEPGYSGTKIVDPIHETDSTGVAGSGDEDDHNPGVLFQKEVKADRKAGYSTPAVLGNVSKEIYLLAANGVLANPSEAIAILSEEEPTTNDWSEAARHAAQEARKAKGSTVANDMSKLANKMSDKARLDSEHANVVGNNVTAARAKGTMTGEHTLHSDALHQAQNAHAHAAQYHHFAAEEHKAEGNKSIAAAHNKAAVAHERAAARYGHMTDKAYLAGNSVTQNEWSDAARQAASAARVASNRATEASKSAGRPFDTGEKFATAATSAGQSGNDTQQRFNHRMAASAHESAAKTHEDMAKKLRSAGAADGGHTAAASAHEKAAAAHRTAMTANLGNFASEDQRKFLFSQEPEIAHDWAHGIHSATKDHKMPGSPGPDVKGPMAEKGRKMAAKKAARAAAKAKATKNSLTPLRNELALLETVGILKNRTKAAEVLVNAGIVRDPRGLFASIAASPERPEDLGKTEGETAGKKGGKAKKPTTNTCSCSGSTEQNQYQMTGLPTGALDSTHDATRQAAGASVMADCKDARDCAMDALDSARDGDNKAATKHHLMAAKSHDVAATDARKDGDEQSASQHDQAAFLHRKAASMRKATRNSPTSNWNPDAQERAMFAKMDGGGEESSTAHEATKKAEKSGKASHHKAAAAAHREAAEHHRSEGNSEMAKAHSNAARSHSQAARFAHNSLVGELAILKTAGILRNRRQAQKLLTENKRRGRSPAHTQRQESSVTNAQLDLLVANGLITEDDRSTAVAILRNAKAEGSNADVIGEEGGSVQAGGEEEGRTDTTADRYKSEEFDDDADIEESHAKLDRGKKGGPSGGNIKSPATNKGKGRLDDEDDDEEDDSEMEDDDDDGHTRNAKRRRVFQEECVHNFGMKSQDIALELQELRENRARRQRSLARRMVANIRDKSRRQMVYNGLMKKSLNELKLLAEMTPAARDASYAANYLGQAGGPDGEDMVGNRGGVTGSDEDILELPTMNMKEISDEQRKKA